MRIKSLYLEPGDVIIMDHNGAPARHEVIGNEPGQDLIGDDAAWNDRAIWMQHITNGAPAIEVKVLADTDTVQVCALNDPDGDRCVEVIESYIAELTNRINAV